VISFFLTIAVRSKERSVLPEYMALIRRALKSNIGLCIWLIETFSSQDFIKEFFIDCPVHDMARFAAGLLKTAMDQVYEHEQGAIREYIQLLADPELLLDTIRTTQKEHIEEELVINGRQHDDSELTVCSGCAEVTLIKLSGNTAKLPKLIIMINAYLHMSTAVHALRNYSATGLLWAVISAFSMLGDSARLYLLSTHTLGRLLDVFLNLRRASYFTQQQLHDYHTKFRDLTLRGRVPLYVFTKPNYIGIDPERSQVQLSS